MCGIAGIFQPKSGIDPSLVPTMISRLVHRGPDAEGFFSSTHCALGHRRLAIIDLREEANQPMQTADGRYTLVFNGEIYNYKELKSSLAQYPFYTNSDTEVLVAAFQKWGPKCLEKLNGMFAFAVWDEQAKELTLARDRIGIKPLYIARTEQGITFASEIRALMSTQSNRVRLNKSSLVDFLRYQTVHSPNTIIDGIELIPAGHYLTISSTELKATRYWQLAAGKPSNAHGQDLSAIKKHTRELLFKAVERRLISDAPLGAFLSGGIDSSVIVAIMSELHNGAINTFSVDFTEQSYSESEYANLVAKHCRTNHHALQLDPESLLDMIPEALAAMDHPSGDGINTFVVSKLTQQAGLKVALSGLGGDEIFAGYPSFGRYLELHDKTWLWNTPLALRKMTASAIRQLKPAVKSEKIADLLQLSRLNAAEYIAVTRRVFPDSMVSKLIGTQDLPADEMLKLNAGQRIEWEGAGKDYKLSDISRGELLGYTQHVLLRDADQMSMASSLEVRVPFLDHELVEYVLQLPDAVKIGQTPKQLLVESLLGILPNEIVNRPKMGFVFPWDVWMKNELRTLCENSLHRLAKREHFSKEALKNLWNSFLQNKQGVNAARIWPLVALEHWLNRHGVND